ncbi:MAG: flagellar hook-length control protein FliK, partial [Acidothermus cellulolyticus]|nr:flagellar hook-length control protein FliK [Acidothermus cellulolyticus]
AESGSAEVFGAALLAALLGAPSGVSAPSGDGTAASASMGAGDAVSGDGRRPLGGSAPAADTARHVGGGYGSSTPAVGNGGLPLTESAAGAAQALQPESAAENRVADPLQSIPAPSVAASSQSAASGTGSPAMPAPDAKTMPVPDTKSSAAGTTTVAPPATFLLNTTGLATNPANRATHVSDLAPDTRSSGPSQLDAPLAVNQAPSMPSEASPDAGMRKIHPGAADLTARVDRAHDGPLAHSAGIDFSSEAAATSTAPITESLPSTAGPETTFSLEAAAGIQAGEPQKSARRDAGRGVTPGGSPNAAAFDAVPMTGSQPPGPASAAAPQMVPTGSGTVIVPPQLNLVAVLAGLRHASDGGYRLSLQLQPAELGMVGVDVEIRGGTATIHFRPEKADAADALRTSLAQLRSELTAQGLQIGEITVGGSQAETGFAGNHASSGGDQPVPADERETPSPVSSPSRRAPTPMTLRSALDLRI